MKMLAKVLGLLAFIFVIISFLLPYRGSDTLNSCFTMDLEGFYGVFFDAFIIIGILLGAIGWLFSKKSLLFIASILILIGHYYTMDLISPNCPDEKDFFYYLYNWFGYIAPFLFLSSALLFAFNKKQTEPNTEKRPLIISIICLLLGSFVGSRLLMFFLSHLIMKTLEINIMELMILMPNILILTAIIGYWKMQKWGIYLLSIIFICSISIIILGIFNREISIGEILNINSFFSLFIPLITIVIGIFYFKKMK